MKEFLICLVCIVACATFVSLATPPKMFSSKEDMEKMVESEKTLFQVLDNYTNHLEERAQKLRTFHNEFRQAFEEAQNGVEEYLNNPVNAFLFARRMIVTWKQVESVMSADVGKEWTREIALSKLLRGISMPSKKDLAYAAGQLKRLQDQYQLNATEMADGGPYGITLNSDDCFELGREAYEDEDLEHAYDWLQEAHKRVGDGRTVESDIIEYLAAVAYLKGRVRQALQLTERLLELQPKHAKANNNIKFYKKRLEEIEEDKNNAMKKDIIADIVNWQEEDIAEFVDKICQGEVSVRPAVQAKLRCRLSPAKTPFLNLAKFKEEDVYLRPRIILYHDFLTDTDIAKLQAAAMVRLQPHDEEGSGVTSGFTAILPDFSSRSAAAAAQRAADVTGLDISFSDTLEILRYNRNGTYKVHFDHQPVSTPIVRRAGNRMTTVQIYLDSAEGGATVFPALKLAVQPRKGSALVWNNLRQTGLPNDLSLHGTCPVLSDQHWEATKWIRTFGNELRTPCYAS